MINLGKIMEQNKIDEEKYDEMLKGVTFTPEAFDLKEYHEKNKLTKEK